MAQRVQIVGVFISCANRQNACPQDIPQQMANPRRITQVGHRFGQSVGDGELPFRLRQQHDTAIRRDPSAIESGSDLLSGKRSK